MVKIEVGKPSGAHGKTGACLRIFLRLIQFALAITIAGLYGVDLNNARLNGEYMDARWVFAVVVAGLSALTCIAYGVLTCVLSHFLFAWDWILFILWITAFGIFGKMFIAYQPQPDQYGQIRMKHAVWVDLANVALWFMTASYSTLIFFRRPGGSSGKSEMA